MPIKGSICKNFLQIEPQTSHNRIGLGATHVTLASLAFFRR